MKENRNIAARAGRWSAQHRKKAIFGWLAFVIASLALGGMLGTKTLEYQEAGVSDSGKADKAAFEAFPKKADESVLIQSERLNSGEASFRAVVADVTSRLRETKGVHEVVGPYSNGGAGVSPDGRSALGNFELRGDSEKTDAAVDAPLDTVAAARRANPGFRVEQSGEASQSKALSASFEDDFQKAEFSSLPLTLVILVLAFGALVAAGLPVLLAISAVAATIGLLGPISQIVPVDESVSSVILLIGLAVGVDYSLFYLRREREERAAPSKPRSRPRRPRLGAPS